MNKVEHFNVVFQYSINLKLCNKLSLVFLTGMNFQIRDTLPVDMGSCPLVDVEKITQINYFFFSRMDADKWDLLA